jgi:hypothetical protein
MIDDAAGGDGPCETCGQDPADCPCPECPVCGVAGDIRCYDDPGHGLRLSRDQLDGLDRLRVSELEDQIADLRAAIELRQKET